MTSAASTSTFQKSLAPVANEELDKIINEFELQHEYNMSNLQEAMFQLTNANDKVKIDLKKVGLIINELQRKTLEAVPSNPNPSERSYPSL